MNIIDESFYEEKEKVKQKNNSKFLMKLILAIILILILLIMGLIAAMYVIKQSELKIYVDNVETSQIENIMINDENKVYFPIKEISPFLGYTCYKGDYSDRSEDASKCFIQSEDEIANFTLNSRDVYKLQPSGDGNYKTITLKYEIKSINGNLCIESTDMQKAFNLSYTYDTSKNRMYIYTMSHLVKTYTAKVLDYGYVVTYNNFEDQKAVLDGYLIVKKDEFYGVIDTKGKSVLETKYDNIEYLSNSQDFLVESNKKVGVISKNSETKIAILYTSLKLIDNDLNLYLAEKDSKYGIIDANGNIKIYIEYDAIGIDNTKFEKNGIKNKYLLADNIIPVKKDSEWALFDKTGKKLTDFQYESLGYIATTNKDAINLLVIPDYNVLVVCKDGRYGLVNNQGTEICLPYLDDVYLNISAGQKHYYMDYNDSVYNVEDYLDARGVKTTTTTNTITNTTTNETNTLGNVISNKVTNTSNNTIKTNQVSSNIAE